MPDDLDAIGQRCAYYITHDSTSWIRRHVETIQLMSASFARRKLTIDIQLPSDIGMADDQTTGQPEFWVPVVSLSKKPPVANVDLRDERGNVLPLLTKDENAQISTGAVSAAAATLLTGPQSPLLAAVLPELIVRAGVEADLALGIAQAALRQEHGEATTDARRAFDNALRSLTGGSWLWLLLTGQPGSRRVVKFAYDIEIRQPSLRPRRRRVRRYLVQTSGTGSIYRFELVDQGDGNRTSLASRLAARIANASGFAPIDLAIETPYISGSATYHLQVASPPGVETRGIRLLARLKEGAEMSISPRHGDHGVHLYLTNAKVEQMFPAIVTLRVGRRGFLTVSWLAALFIVALLWAFSETGKAALVHPEPAAAALLLVPALLTAFVVRPGEHPVATRLLSGVRIMVITNGLLAVAAAAAVANVKPDAWSAPHAWFVYAIAASIVGGLLTLSWVLSWEWTQGLADYSQRRWRSRGLYFASCLLFVALSAAVTTLAWAQPVVVRGLEGLYVGIFSLLAALSAFAAVTYTRVELSPSAAPIAILTGLVSCLESAAAAIGILHLTANGRWGTPLQVIGYGLWGCLIGLAAQELVVRLSAAGDPS